MSLLFSILLLLAGCAPTKIIRFDYEDYHILAVKGDNASNMVSDHCRKTAVLKDDGTPIGCSRIRACYKKVGGRKGTIIISERHIGCLMHEIAHVENPEKQQWVEQHYPCLGDIK